jgi:acetyl esterase/lipase
MVSHRWIIAATSLLVGLLVCAFAVQLAAQSSGATSTPDRSASSQAVSASCGELAFVEGLTATYAIAKRDCLYGTDTPSLTRITDMRHGALFEDKEDYEMRALTVYRAYDGGTPLSNQPVIFYVHGGGWTDNYRSQFQFLARSLTGEMGWVTVIIDYRLTSDQVFLADEYCPDRETCATNEISRTKAAWYPDNLHDVAAALEWTVENAADHGGNPDQIFAFGHSAGAHLMSLVATHSDYAATLRPSMKGVISMSGGYWLNELNKAFWTLNVNQTFKGGFGDAANLDEASPATYVVSDTILPPFQILYAETELPSLTNQSIGFVNLLKSHDLPVTYERLEGYDHVSEMTATEYITETPTALIVDFITDNLRTYHGYLPLIRRR